MERERKGSSTVTFCFSDEQNSCQDYSNLDEMREEIRVCHSSPCFASFDDPVLTSSLAPVGAKWGADFKKQTRRGSSPQDARNRMSPSNTIKKELR